MLICLWLWRCVCGGKSDSQNGWTALIRAAERGRTDCVRLLIDAGADKDVRNNVRIGHCVANVQSYFVPRFIFSVVTSLHDIFNFFFSLYR
jgi:ankyrin repeat protein